MTIPATKAARQARILEILAEHSIRSQSELAEHLAADGVHATQATLSRDLVELGAERTRRPDGALVYAVPGTTEQGSAPEAGTRLAGLFRDLLVTAEASGNIVLLRTPPGAAQFLASALDHTALPEALGTIAGDDTVMVISRDPEGGAALAGKFLELAGG